MSSIFDFRIRQSVYKQALDSYKKMETTLETELEKQQNNSLTMKQNWSGASAVAFQNSSDFFLHQGKYEQAYQQIQGMRKLIEETLPEVNGLLARCEGFLDELQSDSYVEPIKPVVEDNTVRNGDVLALNYDMIAVLKDKCDEISEENQALTRVLEEIMDDCRGEIDNIDIYKDRLEKASKKIDRVLNYRESFQRYELGIKALEFDMQIRLRALAENTEGMYGITEISQTKLGSGELEGIQRVTKQVEIPQRNAQAEYKVETLRAVQTSTPEEQAMVQTDTIEEQTVDMDTVNRILAKSPEDWTKQEAQMIAEALIYGSEHGDEELVEKVLKCFCDVSCKTDTKIGIGYSTQIYTYTYHGNAAVIDKVLEQLDQVKDRELYNLLHRMKDYEGFDETAHVYTAFSTEAPTYIPNLGIDVICDKQGISKITFTCGKEKTEYVRLDFSNTEITSSLVLNIMGENGCKEIEKTWALLTSQEDVDFLVDLYHQDYLAAYTRNPDELSDLAKNQLAGYQYALGISNDSQVAIEEIQKQVNIMLDYMNESQTYHNGEYILIISQNLPDYSREYSELMQDMYVNRVPMTKEFFDIGHKGNRTQALWNSFAEIYTRENTKDLNFLFGPGLNTNALGLQVRNLHLSNSSAEAQYGYSVDIIDNVTGEVVQWNGEVVIQQKKSEGIGVATTLLQNENYELQGTLDDIVIDTCKKTFLGAVSTYLPAVQPFYNVISAIDGSYTGDDAYYQSSLATKFDADDIYYFTNEDISNGYADSKTGISLFSSIAYAINSGVKNYEKTLETINQNRQYIQIVDSGQYYTTDIMIMNRDEDENGQELPVSIKEKPDDTLSLNAGVNTVAPEIQYNMLRWEYEGIDAYLKDVGISDENITEVKERLQNLPTGVMAAKIAGEDAKSAEVDAIQAEIEEVLDAMVNKTSSNELTANINNTSPEIKAVIETEINGIIQGMENPSDETEEDIYTWLRKAHY